MRIFKRVIAFLFALILMESVFTFLLEPVTFEHFLNYDIREMKKNNEGPFDKNQILEYKKIYEALNK